MNFPIPIAGLFSRETYDVIAVIAVVITLIGVRVTSRLTWHRFEAEEAVKDGKITDQQAVRRIRFFNLCSPVLLLVGVGLLVTALVGL